MKTWFITGASSGLGRTMTESLLARGDRVAATVRRPGALDELIAKHGDRIRLMVVDLTDTARLRGEVDAAFAALGRIDVVVSNAAYGLFGAVEEVSDEQMERQIATNLIAPMQLVRACLPHLRRQGGGRIVQISSEGGQVIYPSFGVFLRTRAAHRRRHQRSTRCGWRGRSHGAKAKLFITHLRKCFGDPPYWERTITTS